MSGKIAPLAGALAAISLLGTGLAPGSAQAQETGRYRLEKTQTGYVRLDTRTGALSVCTEQQAQLVCKMATEDREAYENDISDLQDRVKQLENKVAALEKAGAPAASALPSEDEFEKSMSYMERFMRRFMDIARSFDREAEEPQPDPAPGRT
ncbi:hypothetical protein DKP76_01180 [Falsochrobactrum shanghaiense]|uniref:Uncharacterized protein n=1 Tax=Falsochrobactrum shanghaiense TaxID=2201899 RepID=A0A316JD37_9HYPH|nr:hypothetical protein [Falsochrobactrum shanghaiense]PWL19208.1 hypothetical protein DKP76_01180 [Falsochrobactrum shanghaiense]